MFRVRTSIGIFSILLLGLAGTAQAVLTPGATLNFEAGVSPDSDNDNVWESTTATQTRNWTFGGGSQTPVAVPDWDRPNIDHAYVMPAAKATTDTYGDGYATIDATKDVSIELWFNPDDLTGRHVLFETGGNGNGFSFALDGDEIALRAQAGTGNRAVAARDVHGGQTNGLVQVVAVLDVDNGASGSTLDTYINGVWATSDTTSAVISKWAGGHASGLGSHNGSTAGWDDPTAAGFTDFNGQIAIHRVYAEKLLTPDEVFDNFAAVSGLTQDHLYASWDATSETAATDDPWNPHYDAATAFNWNPTGTAQPTVDTLTPSARPGILAAYQFNGGNSRAAGPAHNSGGVGLSTGDFSLEMWFKPDDLLGQELLWEAGGSGSGSSLRLDDANLYFRTKNGAILEEVTSTLTDPQITDFVQVVATVSTADDTLALYVNGLLADSISITGLSEWAGGALSAIGGFDNEIGGTTASTGGDLAGFTSLVGQIAIVRYYTDDLTADEVLNNFYAVATVPEPSSLAMLLGLAGVGLLGYLRRRRKG